MQSLRSSSASTGAARRSNASLSRGAVLSRRPSPPVHAFFFATAKAAPAGRTLSAKVTKESVIADVSSQFDRWNSALATLDPKKVAALYAQDGVLLPTVSNKVRTSPEEIEDYFTNFLKLKPQGKIDDCNVRLLADDTAINSGVYTFDLVKDGAPAQVQARYSFTYKLIDGEWLIVDHHSSGMPEVKGNDDLELVAQQFDLWNAALQTGDPVKVANMYGPGAVLLPTVSNKVRTTQEEIAEYFENFLKLKPFGTINFSNVRMLATDLAINSGVYTFKLTKDGKESLVQARYSFTYKKFNGTWKIIDHHSSAMPESEEKKLEEVTGLFEKWNSALQTGDPKKVAALYAPSGVLLPTVSNQVRTTPTEIQDYFTAFLKLKPFGKIDNANVRILGNDTAINSGVYTFDVQMDGKPTKVQARYSFTYKKLGGEWLIVDHHSSGMPEKVEQAVQQAEKELAVAA